LLFRHIQLNAQDKRLTVPARELLDLTVRNHLQVLSRLQKLWTDSLTKELAEGLANGTAWQVHPSAPPTRDQQEQTKLANAAREHAALSSARGEFSIQKGSGPIPILVPRT